MHLLRTIASLIFTVVFLLTMTVFTYEMDETTMSYPFNYYDVETKVVSYIMIVLVGFITITKDIEKLKKIKHEAD